ncbi:T9SS type A sorting domain-containing protein [bacterium]|nr:T9SS type A sorting domain-containing protein [bacterium]
MKPSILLILLIGFAIALPATGGNLTDDTAVNIGYTPKTVNTEASTVRNIGSVELSYDSNDIEVGPVRDDPGADWIRYDDGNPRSLYPTADNWSRTRFTPIADFMLWGVRLQPLNQGPNFEDACEVRVYAEDQNSHDLGDLLWEGEIAELAEIDFDNFENSWNWIELGEDERLEFGAYESFSIIYGPAPGGNYDPNNMNQGDGWWNLFDGAVSDPPRSFQSAGAVPADHDSWQQLSGDLFIRANGEYLDDYIDVAVTGLFNEAEQWLVLPETEQNIVARIENIGNNVQDLLVTFMVYTLDYEPYWNESVGMIIESIDAQEEIEVTCDSTFSSAEVGHFIIEVAVDAQEDSDPDNNIMTMEQIVFDPTDVENDFWVGYCGETRTSGTNGDANTGWITAFGHPGGENPLMVRKFRQFLISDNAVDCRFRIAVYDGGQRYNWMWEGEAQCNNPEGEWVEVELGEDEMETTTYGEGEEAWICYFYSGIAVQLDGNAPVAGVNDDMPVAMHITQNGGDGASPAGTGDYMCQAMFGITQPTGKMLRIEPDPVSFGDSLNTFTEYNLQATFTAFGDQDVEISAMQIGGTAGDYLTIDPMVFTIAAQTEQTVSLRFYADEVVDLEARVRIINDSDNLSHQYIWEINASALGVDDYQVRLPNDFELMQNHPNPFNPTTNIDFALKTAGMVNFGVYDINGRQVSEVVNGQMSAGYHTVEFDAAGLPAGIYVYRITAGDFTSVRKMALIK